MDICAIIRPGDEVGHPYGERGEDHCALDPISAVVPSLDKGGEVPAEATYEYSIGHVLNTYEYSIGHVLNTY